MVQVRSFVKENRASLTSNISGLNQISKTLVKRRDALDETLQYAPAALNNLYLAGNVKQGTLDTRDNVGELVNQLPGRPGRDAVHAHRSGQPAGWRLQHLIERCHEEHGRSAAPPPFAGDPDRSRRGWSSRSTGPWADSLEVTR